jgi:hypothetical protein
MGTMRGENENVRPVRAQPRNRHGAWVPVRQPAARPEHVDGQLQHSKLMRAHSRIRHSLPHLLQQRKDSYSVRHVSLNVNHRNFASTQSQFY